MPAVIETNVPGDSLLYATLASADFYDAYEAPLSDQVMTPTEIFLRAVHGTPRWVARLMSIRNLIVRQLGLKDVGAMDDVADRVPGEYQIGDRLGIFTIFGKTDNELVLGIDDSHLDVRVSVFRSRNDRPMRYVVSTVVKVHNWFGRLYMVPVSRVHPVVAKALMGRVVV
jgi:hypothetical protein